MSVTTISSMKVTFDGCADASVHMKKAMNELCQFGAERIFQLSQEYISDNSVDLTTLLQSGYRIKIADGWWRVGYNAPHGIWVEFGTRAPRKMPPIAPIKAWCLRHLHHKSPNKVIEPSAAGAGIGGKGAGMKPMKVLRVVGQSASKALDFVGKTGGFYGDAAKALKKGQKGMKAAAGVYKNLRRMQKHYSKQKRSKTRADKRDADAESMAWAVAKAIMKNGTEPRPFMRPAVQVTQLEMRAKAKLIIGSHFSGALNNGGAVKR